jgi:excisionase family DNA binding protein
MDVRVELPQEVIDELVELVTALVLERLRPQERSPYMSVPEAAAFLRAKPQRVHDLLSARKLTRFKDGSRTLVLRAELEALVEQRPR